MKDSSVALFKIEKLLEKLEKDIKKHQDKEIYQESEKYMKHAQKTIDLYSLTLDEILSTPGQSNLQRHCSVLKRMFKGMQSQVRSVLKFTLFHFRQRSEKLGEQQNDDDMVSPTNVLDNQNGTLGGLDNRGSTGGSPTDMSGSPGMIRNGKTYMTMMLPHLQMSPQNSSPQSLYTMINSARSPLSNNGYSRGDFVLQNSNFNGYSDERGQWGSLNQFGENEEEDIEMLKFQQEHKRMQEEIDDFLKGKEYVEHISPSKVSSNLKQILRGLEYTTKKVNQIADAPIEGDDDDDFDEPNFGEMSKKIKKAFTQAKVKAVKTIGGLLKANGGQSPRALQDQALALAIAAAEKEIEEIDPKPDSVDEGENEELNELRAKFEKIEKEKAENLEKVKILTQENSELAQDKRQLREKVLELENDIIAIKEMFHTSRLEWADTKAAMKRKFEESQKEWLLKSQKPSTPLYEPKHTPTVSFKVEQHEEKSVASQGEDKEEEENVVENGNNGTEGTPSVKDQGSSQGFSNFATETKAHVEVSTPVIASAQKVNISNETKSDTKSDASRKSQPAEQPKKQSSESGKRVSNNDTLIIIEKPSSETPPLTQPLRIPLNNDSISEKPKDQQPNQQSNPVTLYQNSHNPNPNPNPISNTGSTKTNNSNPKEVMSPRGNIQIRNIKKPNVLPKPVQNPKGRNVVEPKSQQNNLNSSVERAPEKRPNYESKVQQNSSSNSIERMLEKVDKGKKAFERPIYQAHSATKIQNQVRYGLELHDRIKTEGEAPGDDSIDREINALNMQIYLEPKTERIGTANATYSRGNINATRQAQVFQEQQKRTYTAGSPRSNRNQDNKGNGSPAFSPKAEFNGGALSKGFRDEVAQSPRQQPNYYAGRPNADWAGYTSGDKVIQSVLDIKDDYWNQMDYSPKGDLKQHYSNFSKDKQVSRSPTVGMDRFGQVMRSKKVIKRKSMEGLDQYRDQYRGLNSFRDRVAEKGKYNFSPLVMDEVAERLRSEPSSSVRMVFNPKIKAYDLYPESPRSGHYPPQSAYYFENEHSADARFQKHGPQPKTFKVKLTIEECIRQEVLRDTKEPAATKEEAQMRIMYRAMLTRAKQQPKVSAWMKKSIQDANLGPLNEDHPVVDYNLFEQFVTNFAQAHAACGENCSHLRDFYAKIGYLTSWNNREVMSVKRAQIGVSTMDGLLPTPKLPGLKKKKKEIEREMP